MEEGRVALALAAASVVIPAVIWLVMFALGTVSSGVVGPLVILCSSSCLAALAGLIAGIAARKEKRGIIAIVSSLLGGALSLGTLFGMALAMAVGGTDAGP